MRIWMLTKFHDHPMHKDGDGTPFRWPIAASYGGWHCTPRHPDISDGWALAFVECTSVQTEAADQDPRVQPYRTVWDTITPETVTAYAAQGATAGMMLCQLLSLLAKWESDFTRVSS